MSVPVGHAEYDAHASEARAQGRVVMALAFLFPGQGSQCVGMGQDVVDSYAGARVTFEEADALLGWSLSSLCFEGPKDLLDETANTQPAIFVTSVALWRALAEEFRPNPCFFAGHSLGQYAALVASGAMEFQAGLRLVVERAQVMQEAGELQPGGMAAVLGLEDSLVESICQEASDSTASLVQVANYNCPGQVVISGSERGLVEAMERAREMGARRVVRLAVSIAAHSPLMSSAIAPFRRAVEATPAVPRAEVISNVTARPLATVEELHTELVSQLTAPVRWTQSIRWMLDHGVGAVAEVGPGNTLVGLVKRIDRNVERVSVDCVAAIRNLGEAEWA